MPKRNTFNARPVPKKDVKVRDAVTDVASFEYDEEFLEAAKKRISFWRKYPFHMCKHYLGITLKPFQCVLLYQMMNNMALQEKMEKKLLNHNMMKLLCSMKNSLI